jgi:hypothetical protein
MKKIILIPVAVFFLVCCAPLVLVPPEIDLIPLERLGLVVFSVENAEGPLDEMATQRFLEEIQWAQKGVKVVEMGKMEDVLTKVGHSGLDPAAARAVGKEFGVSSFFTGKITVSDIRPRIDISSIVESLRVRASFDIEMSARLISSEDGSTLWTDSALIEENLAYLHLSRRMVPIFSVRDQQDAYRDMIGQMIRRLTRDFRPTRQRLR